VRRIAAIAVVVAGMVVGSTAPAIAGLDDDLSRVGSEVERLRGQVGEVRTDRTDLANLILDTGARLQALAENLAASESRLADTDREIALTEYRMEDLSARMTEREQRVADLGTDIESIRVGAVERAVELYMQGDTKSTVMLLQAGDVNRFSVRPDTGSLRPLDYRVGESQPAGDPREVSPR